MPQEQIILQVGNTARAPNGDQYVIEELLGKGGFGAVYLVRARDNEHKRFALKEVIDPNERDRERFMFEAELLKRLNHRVLPRVYTVFENEKLKRVYMLMDYVNGRDLEVLLTDQPDQRFSLPLAIAIMTPIVDALTYMHTQVPPVVHRDIKPANIIVSTKGEEAVLVDFGLAKEYVSDKTTSIIRHGSPGYAALEQYAHEGTTSRTDIYGLGATFYTMVTGVIPIEVISRIIQSKGFDPLQPANRLNPTIPTAVSSAIQRAMSISIDERFKTVEEFWQEVTTHAADQPENTLDKTVQSSQSVALKIPQPLNVTERELPPVTTDGLAGRQPTSRFQRHGPWLPLVFALLIIIGVLGISLLFSLFWQGNTDARLKAGSYATGSATTPSVTHTPTSISISSSYPTLASSYSGTIGALIANKKTAMFLTSVQQHQQNIQGTFKGLGLVGPFKGTVSFSEHLQFTVIIYGGNSTLAFQGDIKIGGDMAGSYQVLDQRGQPTGEAGLWNVSSSS